MQSQMPALKTISYVDESGIDIRAEIDMMGTTMVFIATEKEVAQQDFSPPELMRTTLVHPDNVIEHPRSTRKAVYIVQFDGDGAEHPRFTASGVQRAEALDDGRVRITLDLDAPSQATPEEQRDARFLATSSLIDGDDELIRELAQRVAGQDNAADPGKTAEALRQFVHTHINEKSLGVGFAAASEVARTREGDCTEHSVLLAALLRARGIPSRTVSGLVYTSEFVGSEDVFVYHMWTQAILQDSTGVARWVDLDAVLSPAHAMDAAHIAVLTSPLDNGDMLSSLGTLVQIIGSISIAVESTQ